MLRRRVSEALLEARLPSRSLARSPRNRRRALAAAGCGRHGERLRAAAAAAAAVRPGFVRREKPVAAAAAAPSLHYI